MKKFLFSTIALLLLSVGTSFGQVEFSKFTFKKDSPMGMYPTRKMTATKFKVTGDRALKYIHVFYYGVNQVNDAVSSDIYGGVNANVEHTKYSMLNLTGPFEPGKKYSRWASGSFFYKMKVTAFPYRIELMYMDGEEETIDITKENLPQFFPCLKWIDVNVEDGI